jgi:hypothetical protein
MRERGSALKPVKPDGASVTAKMGTSAMLVASLSPAVNAAIQDRLHFGRPNRRLRERWRSRRGGG